MHELSALMPDIGVEARIGCGQGSESEELGRATYLALEGNHSVVSVAGGGSIVAGDVGQSAVAFVLR